MFRFEREWSQNNPSSLLAAQSQKRTLQQRQKDVFDSHRHRAFSLAYYMTGNEVEAEEVLRETFLRAFRVKEEPDADLVDSSLIEELRTRLAFEKHSEPVPCSIPGDLGDQNVRRTDLEEAVQELPTQERLVYLLRDVEAYAPEAIASLLKMGIPEVNRTLMSARLRLRQLLLAARARRPEAAA